MTRQQTLVDVNTSFPPPSPTKQTSDFRVPTDSYPAKQTYSILEKVVTGNNVATVMKDISSIDVSIKSFFLIFK